MRKAVKVHLGNYVHRNPDPIAACTGVPVDSDLDFATPYMRHALRFLGITDIEVVSAEQQNSRGEIAVDAAVAQIAGLFQESENPAQTASTI